MYAPANACAARRVSERPCTELQRSISEYYVTAMRDVLVGVLFAIAWFLFSYRGYESKDDIAGDLACGVIMLACIASIGLYYGLLQDTSIAAIKPVFWLESLVLWAFGCSWFVKGETLWRDAEGTA